MNDNDAFTVETKGLDQLLKALKAKPPTARVGILGSKGVRSSEGNQKNVATNAEIGAVHEFGSPSQGIRQRSFLRIPVSENLGKEMENSGALDKSTLNDVVKSGTIIPWMKKIALLAEKIVGEAFDSGGFGKWPAWKNKAYTNNTGMLLVDSQQLRNSITSEVK